MRTVLKRLPIVAILSEGFDSGSRSYEFPNTADSEYAASLSQENLFRRLATVFQTPTKEGTIQMVAWRPFIMANRKKEVYKPKPMTEGKRNLIQGLLQEYDIQSAEDIQDALKDLLSGTIQDMLEAEMDDHLGYDRYERSGEPNYRNGMKSKTVRSKYGEFQVDVPQDRQSSFEPQILPKRQKDISSIDDKIISMYAKGMTTRQISETIEDIYGFEVSEGMVSDISFY